MLLIKAGNRDLHMAPGNFRSTPEEDVSVGRHVPPSSERVEAFVEYFADRYRSNRLGAGQRIIAIPAAHHRLNYIHPFLDGNGRVSRLVSHAMALKADIGAHGLWSISRGLARGLESRGDYKRMMDHADMPRQGDLDGRGNLSRRALMDFTIWSLRVCLDQVNFMEGLFGLETLIGRLKLYVERRGLKSEALPLLEQVLLRGEFPRGELHFSTQDLMTRHHQAPQLALWRNDTGYPRNVKFCARPVLSGFGPKTQKGLPKEASKRLIVLEVWLREPDLN